MRVHGQLLLKLARIVDSQPVAPSRFLPRRRAVASSSLHSAGEVLHSSIGLRGAPHAALHAYMLHAHVHVQRSAARSTHHGCTRGTRGGQRSARWFRARAHANQRTRCVGPGPGSAFAFASTVFATVLTVASWRRPPSTLVPREISERWPRLRRET